MARPHALLLAAVLSSGCTPPARSPSTATVEVPPASAAGELPEEPTTPAKEKAHPAQSALETIVNEDGDRIPAGWKPEEMAAAPLHEAQSPNKQVTAKILAWGVKVDERPLYVESALLWVRVQQPGGRDQWMLAKVFRHPRSGPGATWQLAIVFDAPQNPLVSYNHPPTNKDVARFIEESWWNDGMAGFQELGAGVSRNGWEIAIGEPALVVFK